MCENNLKCGSDNPVSAAPRWTTIEGVPTLLSVNVGLPKNVPWQDETVFTSVWKYPVTGARMVRKLNIDGLISRTYKLQDINEGFKRMMAGEVARGVVVFD